MDKIRLRKAKKSDMALIEGHIKKFRLDDENINFEQFIVAEKEGKVAGFGRIKPCTGCFELGCLGVLEPYRNRGVGATILKRLIQDFPADEVWITTDMPEYFAQFGFKPTEEAPREIAEKIERVCQAKQRPDAVIMLLHKGG